MTGDLVERSLVFPIPVELDRDRNGVEVKPSLLKLQCLPILRFSQLLQTWIRVLPTLPPIYSQTSLHQWMLTTQVGLISMILRFHPQSDNHENANS